MTLPYERARSLQITRDFLYKLLDPKKSPRIPKTIRRQAGDCLRHFPHDLEIEQAQEKQPELWGSLGER